MITDEEKDMVLEYIILNNLLALLDKDARIIEKAPFKIKEAYKTFLELVTRRILKDRKNLKDRMKIKKIKVMDAEPINEDFVLYKYVVNGFENEMRLFRSALRNYVLEKMNQYFALR